MDSNSATAHFSRWNVVWNEVQWVPNQNMQVYQQPQQYSKLNNTFRLKPFIHQPIKEGSSAGLVLGIIAAV